MVSKLSSSPSSPLTATESSVSRRARSTVIETNKRRKKKIIPVKPRHRKNVLLSESASSSSSSSTSSSPSSTSSSSSSSSVSASDASEDSDDLKTDDDDDDDDNELYSLGDLTVAEQKIDRRRGPKKILRTSGGRLGRPGKGRSKKFVESTSSSSKSSTKSSGEEQEEDETGGQDDHDDEKIVADVSHQQQLQQQQSMCVSQREVEVMRGANGTRVVKLDAFESFGFIHDEVVDAEQRKKLKSTGSNLKSDVSVPQVCVTELKSFPVCCKDFITMPNYVKYVDSN